MTTTSSTPQLADAVGLLERAVGYTRGTLADVTTAALGNPTPCRAWDLGQLLAHLDDSLDAFTEASAGAVELTGPPGGAGATRRDPAAVVDRIRVHACALLGGWAAAARDGGPGSGVRVGDRVLPGATLVYAGALEVAVHGWDVGQSTGRAADLPAALAAALRPVAHALVGAADRPARFGPIVPGYRTPGPEGSVASVHAGELLGFLGRIV